MKIKNALLAILTVLTIASAGQTMAGPEAGPYLGTIIVYRPCTPFGAFFDNLSFNLNHGPERMLRNGTYYRLTVLPGDSIISHDDILIDNDPQTVHVEPGQTVYFEYAVELVLIFEVASNQEKAAITVSKLQPVN
jgi:hypothetical protein